MATTKIKLENLQNIEGMSVFELDNFIQKAKEVRKTKATPAIKTNMYITSISKHVLSILEAYKKLKACEGVSDEKWNTAREQLKRISLDTIDKESDAVTPRPRGRVAKVSKEDKIVQTVVAE